MEVVERQSFQIFFVFYHLLLWSENPLCVSCHFLSLFELFVDRYQTKLKIGWCFLVDFTFLFFFSSIELIEIWIDGWRFSFAKNFFWFNPKRTVRGGRLCHSGVKSFQTKNNGEKKQDSSMRWEKYPVPYPTLHDL